MRVAICTSIFIFFRVLTTFSEYSLHLFSSEYSLHFGSCILLSFSCFSFLRLNLLRISDQTLYLFHVIDCSYCSYSTFDRTIPEMFLCVFLIPFFMIPSI